MKNAILLDGRIINTDHVIFVLLDRSPRHRVGPHHIVQCLDDTVHEFAADSAEGRALKWWFLEADRADMNSLYRTIDLVQSHRDAIERSAYPAIPARGRLHIAPMRDHRDRGPVVVAEAVQDEPGRAS